ncbi:MAG: c-type cytochrome [Desulfobacterales bacterium]|nr:MAG: c-type cytochrome [Desulfobacterales bacterium]UCD91124.1 MAG: c-type cytochrome [Desulfobacterales bacterium]
MIESIYLMLAKIGYTHPIHPAITHVPVGLTIGGFVFDITSRFLTRPVLAQTARHCMVLALISVIPAMLLGYLDWQHFYGGAWLFPIKMKIFLAGMLLILLSSALILGLKPEKNANSILLIYAFCLAMVLGLGYFGGELVYGSKTVESGVAEGPVADGARIFNASCAACHYPDKTETKIGPGFQGLFNRESMPSSGLPVSGANIRKQLKTPMQFMPPFSDLPEEDIEALIAYLKTL